MYVIKRNKSIEPVNFNKVLHRLANLSHGLNLDISNIAQLTIANIHNYIETSELDIIAARISYDKLFTNINYSILAKRLIVSNIHKQTPCKFSEVVAKIKAQLNPALVSYVEANSEFIDNIIVHERDYDFTYFGIVTLSSSYLIKVTIDVLDKDGNNMYTDGTSTWHQSDVNIDKNGIFNKAGQSVKKLTKKIVVERPQYMYMRIALSLYLKDLLSGNTDNFIKCYNMISTHLFTHATPTLYNAGLLTQQLASCFLLGTDDSVTSIMRTAKKCSMISRASGGIGLHMSNIRSANQPIVSTGGTSSGIIPQCQIYNAIALCWDQGGRRKGAISIYIEPHHGDIIEFLQLKLNNNGGRRIRDLFYALWISDLFMECVMNDQNWYLFSENTAVGLSDVYDGMMVCTKCNHCVNSAYAKYILGDKDAQIGQPYRSVVICDHDYQPNKAYTALYNKYKNMGLFVNVVKARDVFDHIITSLRESGGPYICFKDSVNRQTNHENIGTIKSSNLCTEIMQYSGDRSYAVCTLASINIKKFIKSYDATNVLDNYDFAALHDTVRMITRNLNKVIDINAYPVPECRDNSMKYRPIGIGIQGLADLFIDLKLPFISPESEKLDLAIAETIYHAGLTESISLAEKTGHYYDYDTSPLSSGILAPDMWERNQTYIGNNKQNIYSGLYDWDEMRRNIRKYGVRNSLLVAYMPTVSTSQILGNNESFEPIPACMYTKTVLNGKFIVANESLVKTLDSLGIWSEVTYTEIINAGGSIQNISKIPQQIKNIYKTVYEIPQSDLIKRTSLRGAWIDQAQSFNIHIDRVDPSKLRGIICMGWKLGLKTGIYYLRTKPASVPIKTNIAVVAKCDGDVCTSCSS